MKLNTSTEFSLRTLRLYAPCPSLVVPLVVPFSIILTPGIGVPFSSVIFPVTVKTNDYVLGNDKLPAVSASVSKDSEGKIHISLVNIDATKSQDISLNLPAGKYATVTGRILSSAKLQDHNSFETPDKIKPAAFRTDAGTWCRRGWSARSARNPRTKAPRRTGDPECLRHGAGQRIFRRGARG